MENRILILVLFFFIAVSCSGPVEIAPIDQVELQPSQSAQDNSNISDSEQDAKQSQQEIPLLGDKIGPNCLGEEINIIGQAIADEYEFASYEEVMTWFCNGAEFEDIMIALQTEDQTEEPAEEILIMLADGFTWEEIWSLLGLNE